jgi:LPXTG-motif cell wall-anchored protein
MLAPAGGNGLPATGASPAILVAAGRLMVGLGLAALLVRRSP